jgi:acyl-[acyl-carrier-protein]-phospholipid O-acyltransferase/long-chain-fatty-acid--[acyl-carrier-protein] ligase
VVIANHLSYVDVVVLQLACPRPLRFLAYNGPGTGWFLSWIFKSAGVIVVAPDNRLQWLRDSVKALEQGELVCVFPEGEISRTGQLMAIRNGYELVARKARVPVVPVAIDGLWGSVFSFAGNKYLWKSPRLMPTPVCVAFGKPIPFDRADAATAREALWELGTLAFDERPALRRHIGRETVRALARRPRSIALIDRTSGRRVLTAAQLIAAAAVLSRHIRRTVAEKRVGIVLPPGAGAAIANLAVVCAGKVPVNFNFTAGRASVQSAIAESGVRTLLTADAFRERFSDFPWPERTVDFRSEMAAAGGKRAMIPWLAAAWLLPNQWVAGIMGLPHRGDREEAALLFTSGSAGNPRGVVLSHRNLLANWAQISSLAILPDSAVMLGCLPMFHSFGFTFTLWYPFIRGCHLVTSPSALDTRALVDTIREEGITVLLGAPTFLRPILKRATSADMKSLELVVTGAEKLPEDLRRGFLERFHIGILEGYGLTETSPVASLNQPHPPITTATAAEQIGHKPGTVGRLLPGMAPRIIDPETGVDLPIGKTGILLLRGANIFSKYLDEATPGECLRDGWFVTWDLARIDEDGFVVVEGRLARFSKMGGEMVPHGTIEQKIEESFLVEPGDIPAVVVTGVPDEMKGEALVVVTTLDISAGGVREKLSAAGYPNLWIPRSVVRVGAIPILGTGKLDIAGCKRLALGGRSV